MLRRACSSKGFAEAGPGADGAFDDPNDLDVYGHLFPTPEDDQAAMRQLRPGSS
jgi:hypothetical protein